MKPNKVILNLSSTRLSTTWFSLAWFQIHENNSKRSQRFLVRIENVMSKKFSFHIIWWTEKISSQRKMNLPASIWTSGVSEMLGSPGILDGHANWLASAPGSIKSCFNEPWKLKTCTWRSFGGKDGRKVKPNVSVMREGIWVLELHVLIISILTLTTKLIF